jgi:uncharacterized membrane protein YtjA (UPF0391 family)
VQQGWQEFKQGWAEASWGSYFALALFPLIMAISFLTYLIEGKVSSPPTPLFWLLSTPAVLASLYWAGLKSGPSNWLGRLVFAVTLVLLVILLVRRMIRTGENEVTITRRIGRAKVTIPVQILSEEDEPVEASRRSPPWWNRFRATFETLSTALHIAGRATWST